MDVTFRNPLRSKYGISHFVAKYICPMFEDISHHLSASNVNSSFNNVKPKFPVLSLVSEAGFPEFHCGITQP